MSKARFSTSSAEKMLSICNSIDNAIVALDELPESVYLSDVIDTLSSVMVKLDAIIIDTLPLRSA